MDFEKLFMMLSLSEKLMGHPRYAATKLKVDKAIDAMIAGDQPRAVVAEPEPIESEPEPETSAVPRRI